MTIREPRRDHPDRLAAILLGATFLVVALLLGQALTTLRSHESMVETTLDDFATFASERLAAELNSTFTSMFLDRIALARSAHEAWVAGEDATDVIESARAVVPGGAIPFYFSIENAALITRGGDADAPTAEWVLNEVTGHLRGGYPRPAPYALIRSVGPSGSLAVAYRREEAYGRVSVFGFVIRFQGFEPIYARILNDTPILPASLADEATADDLVTVDLNFPQTGETLFRTASARARTVAGPGGEVVRARAIVAKAGRMAVDVELDAAGAIALLPGGSPTQRVLPLAALALLTFGLLAMAVALIRRADRLRRMREAFVTNISHDLRTPLSQIRMFSETLLLDRIPDPRERRRSLEIIHRQASHLGDLVANILHVSGRDRASVRPEPTRLADLLEDVTDALAPSAAEKGVRLEGRVAGTALAPIDPLALRRILVNLVDNAIKYGPRDQTVRVALRNRGDVVEVMVEDEGPGIPKRERSRVLERFYRLDHQGKAITGVGIGLAVVRELAERHGGAVRLEEAEGGGTRVVVTLAAGSSSSDEPAMSRSSGGAHAPDSSDEERTPSRSPAAERAAGGRTSIRARAVTDNAVGARIG